MKSLTDMILQGYGIDDMLAKYDYAKVSNAALKMFRDGEIDFKSAQFIAKGLRRRRNAAARELLKSLSGIETQIQKMERAS